MDNYDILDEYGNVKKSRRAFSTSQLMDISEKAEQRELDRQANIIAYQDNVIVMNVMEDKKKKDRFHSWERLVGLD